MERVRKTRSHRERERERRFVFSRLPTFIACRECLLEVRTPLGHEEVLWLFYP